MKAIIFFRCGPKPSALKRAREHFRAADGDESVSHADSDISASRAVDVA